MQAEVRFRVAASVLVQILRIKSWAAVSCHYCPSSNVHVLGWFVFPHQSEPTNQTVQDEKAH